MSQTNQPEWVGGIKYNDKPNQIADPEMLTRLHAAINAREAKEAPLHRLYRSPAWGNRTFANLNGRW